MIIFSLTTMREVFALLRSRNARGNANQLAVLSGRSQRLQVHSGLRPEDRQAASIPKLFEQRRSRHRHREVCPRPVTRDVRGTQAAQVEASSSY